MVRDYVTHMYEPMAKQSRHSKRPGLRQGQGSGRLEAARARSLGKVAVVSVDIDAIMPVTDLGGTMSATVEVALGDLAPAEVSVELLHGPVTANDDLAHWQMVRMERDGPSEAPGVDPVEGKLRVRRRRPPRVHRPGRARATLTSRCPPNWAWKPGPSPRRSKLRRVSRSRPGGNG